MIHPIIVKYLAFIFLMVSFIQLIRGIDRFSKYFLLWMWDKTVKVFKVLLLTMVGLVFSLILCIVFFPALFFRHPRLYFSGYDSDLALYQLIIYLSLLISSHFLYLGADVLKEGYEKGQLRDSLLNAGLAFGLCLFLPLIFAYLLGCIIRISITKRLIKHWDTLFPYILRLLNRFCLDSK